VPFVEKLWTISYSGPTISYDAPSSSIAGGCGIADNHWYTKPFRLEILGDWTQGWETIGLDNVEII